MIYSVLEVSKRVLVNLGRRKPSPRCVDDPIDLISRLDVMVRLEHRAHARLRVSCDESVCAGHSGDESHGHASNQVVISESMPNEDVSA
jgi:hypothetical protein